jgi:hypothetical protein
LKPTKKLALQVANMLELSALEPDEDLDWHAVREVTECITGEGKLDSFQLDLLTDWVYKIAAARLGWLRGRPTGKLLVSFGGAQPKKLAPCPTRSKG